MGFLDLDPEALNVIGEEIAAKSDPKIPTDEKIEFKDGKRHGFGVSEFPNGTKYSGKYKFGSEDGEGIYEDKEGQKHTLNYINGTPYQDGKVFDFKGEEIPSETSSNSDGNLFDTIMFLFSFILI